MKKSRLNSKGFSHVEMFFLLLVILAVGGVGYYVWQHNNTAHAGSWQLLGYNKVYYPLFPNNVHTKPQVSIVLRSNLASHVTARVYACYENTKSNVTYGLQATLGPTSNGAYLNASQNKFLLVTAQVTYKTKYTIYIKTTANNSVPIEELKTNIASRSLNSSSNWSNQAQKVYATIPKAYISSATLYISVKGINHFNTTISTTPSKVKSHC